MLPDDKEDVLSDDEKRAYGALGLGPPLPAALEGRVVRALRRQGLLSPPRWRRAGRWALAAAAGAVLFLGGRASVPAAAPAPSATGPRFVLFLEEPEAAPLATGAEERARVEEYSRWARQQAAAGALLGGEKLKDEAAVLRGAGSAQGPSRTAGYFLVTVADLDAAVELARSCPHLRHGGDIVVRPIDPLP